MLKLFTTPKGVSIAINPDLVICVVDDENGCMIKFESGTQMVSDPYLEVIAKLNEKK